jgi:S-adenosylmethionine hydrolase
MGPIGLPMALISSSGHLEVAVWNGNAAKALGVTAGDRLRVMPERSG